MTGLYARWILPHVVHLTMRQDVFTPYRRRAVSSADGRVLEIGIGSGLNLPYYSGRVTHIVGLDPSHKLLSKMTGRCQVIEGNAERIPLDDSSIDTVVTTWTLCTIPDVSAALKEMHRVLKPSGRLLFVEHGLSPDADVRRWQHRLTPAWKHLAGGCHLDRPIRQLVEAASFTIERLDMAYMRGPRPMTYMYEGTARR